MSRLNKDVESARSWLTTVAVNIMRRVLVHESTATRLMDVVETITCCAELPGDMALRVRLTPNVFGFRA